MSFDSEFKRIFSETFQLEGFQYCSKLNAFVKMLNEDLMAYFGVKTAPAWNKGAKGFFLTAGIISIYYSSIDKKSILYAGQDLNSFLPRNEARVSFEYNEDTMEEIISTTASYVKERLMPIFNQVYDLKSFIDFLKEYSINKLRGCDTFKGESLILIKTDNHDDFQKYFQQHLDELYARIDAGDVGDGYTKEMAYDDLFHGIIESIVYSRDKVYSDRNLYNEALEEAERRKNENVKKLHNYKLL
jgi:hypothetical protein